MKELPPLRHYEELKKAMEKDGISQMNHVPCILEFLLQRERIMDTRLAILEKRLDIEVKVLKE